MTRSELREYLDFKAAQYNQPAFVKDDPIQLPHRFSRKEDIEIIGLLVATIAWGKRELIIRSGEKIIRLMGEDPYGFVMNYAPNDLPDFVHRTFNGEDLDFFFRSLRNIYEKDGLEAAFSPHPDIPGAKGRIIQFRERFLDYPHETRSEKHLSDPGKNSAAKRLNMFLRWMVRKDNCGVDFGIWNSVDPSELSIPLDVHTANVSRKLGLLQRKQNDWKALDEIMEALREFDPKDPAKYDFALFGIGAYEK